MLVRSAEDFFGPAKVFVRSDVIGGTSGAGGLRTYGVRWEASTDERFVVGFEFPLELTGAGEIELYMDAAAWATRLDVSEESPDPIVITIGPAVERRLTILSNDGPFDGAQLNVYARPAGMPYDSFLGELVVYDDQVEAWIVVGRADRMEIQATFKRDGSLMRTPWTPVSWPDGRGHQTLDLTWDAELEVSIVNEDRRLERLWRSRFTVRGPDGGPVGFRDSRNDSLFEYRLPAAGLYSITLDSEHQELVGGEQWVQVPAGERARIEVVVRDLPETD